MVLLAAIWTIMPKPVSTIIASEIPRFVEKAKPIKPTPNRRVPIHITFPSPNTVLRDAKNKAPVNAPTPDAADRNPSVSGPPRRIFLAKIGISTVYGIPMKLTRANSSRIVRIGAKPKAYRNPSCMPRHIGGG